MSMKIPSLKQLAADAARIEARVKNEVPREGASSWPITDGVVDVECYLRSSPRVMWFLKEPYDEGKGDDANDGGWSISDALREKTDLFARARALQPICYVLFGLRKRISDWDQMPWLKDSEEVRNTLHEIAFINVSKMPGYVSSPWGKITSAYEKHRDLLLDQIESYAPEVIFACDPQANLLKRDLGKDDQDWIHFGSASATTLRNGVRLVWVYHPSYPFKRRVYVNDAIRAAQTPL